MNKATGLPLYTEEKTLDTYTGSFTSLKKAPKSSYHLNSIQIVRVTEKDLSYVHKDSSRLPMNINTTVATTPLTHSCTKDNLNRRKTMQLVRNKMVRQLLGQPDQTLGSHKQILQS